MPRTAVSTPLIRDGHRTAASTGTGDHHALAAIDRWAGMSQPRHEQCELLDTGLPGPARPGAPAQEQHDRVRIRLRRGLGRVAAEPLMPQILIGDPNYLQILIQHRPIPLPGRQTHRECSHGLSLSGRQSETTTSHEHHTPGETPQHQPDRQNRATSRNRSGNPGEGMRMGEALGLRHNDIAAAEREITVVRRDNDNGARAKSIIDRTVPVSAELVRLYADYLHAEYGDLDSDYVFVNLWGRPLGRPWTYAAAYDLVCRLRRRTGVEFDPHWIRHTAATRMLRDGISLEVVAKLLGHSNVTVTATTYGHLTVEDARAVMEKAGWFDSQQVAW